MYQKMQEVASSDTNKTEPIKTTTMIETPFDYKLEPKQISENVWCFLGLLEGPSTKNTGAMSNSC